jgi:hypothetical protein
MTPFSADVLNAFNSALAGIRYGVKIRLPHALLMALLFPRSRSPSARASQIYRAVMTHAWNLGKFVLVYKAALLLLKHSARLDPSLLLSARPGHILGSSPPPSFLSPHLGRPFRPSHAALAGALGGYLVWGEYEHVNYQIILYLLSRVIAGGCRSLASRGVRPFSDRRLRFENTYPALATVTWAAVMYLFECDPDKLQRSLTKSMQEIYHQEDVDSFVLGKVLGRGADTVAGVSVPPGRVA